MLITKMALPRRTFLRGVGATLALPLLDAMVPALTPLVHTAAKPTPRLGFFYVPNGMHMPAWKPKVPGAGAAFELSPSLTGLQPLKEYVTVLGGLNNYAANSVAAATPHVRNQAAWLSGVLARQGAPEARLGTTVDQYAASALGKETVHASLELATDPADTATSCGNGFSDCLYSSTLSWKSATVPNPMESNPTVLFERLFGDEADPKAQRARMRFDKSILDTVRSDLTLISQKIGASDRMRVGEYLDAVREVETRIQKAQQQSASSTFSRLDRPVGVPDTFDEHVMLMFDLIHLAYQADLTRVISFAIAKEQGSKNYSNIGVPEGHHECSHHQNDPYKQGQLAKINIYHIKLLHSFLEKMEQTNDGDGSLLDHSAMVYGAGQSDGDLHSPLDLPTILVGRLGGTVKGDQYIDYDPSHQTPLMNLFMALLDKAGVQVEKIGDSTGMLADI